MTELEEAKAALITPLAAAEQVKPEPKQEHADVDPLDRITPSREKFPAGKFLIAVQLNRDESVSRKFMTAVARGWNPSGKAVAFLNGKPVAANFIMGYWRDGEPVVVPAHLLVCPHCGMQVLRQRAIWSAKDHARENGVRNGLEKFGGRGLLDRFGRCRCGSKWRPDVDGEKKILTDFGVNVLKGLERTPEVRKFLPPRAFTVRGRGEAEDLGLEWTWLQDAMTGSGKSVVPIERGLDGDTILFNPGQWLGWADDYESSGLFFREAYEEHLGSERRRGFNPANVNGL